jgi:hypothetical protein
MKIDPEECFTSLQPKQKELNSAVVYKLVNHTSYCFQESTLLG